ncbi:hypothetical protein C8R46DRAFT_1213738 [Mycena filopes]|nr:hypothetical protein C8R46DRAFT_1213738 [Mycena filopes]
MLAPSSPSTSTSVQPPNPTLFNVSTTSTGSLSVIQTLDATLAATHCAVVDSLHHHHYAPSESSPSDWQSPHILDHPHWPASGGDYVEADD